jgi:hypothetical protein
MGLPLCERRGVIANPFHSFQRKYYLESMRMNACQTHAVTHSILHLSFSHANSAARATTHAARVKRGHRGEFVVSSATPESGLKNALDLMSFQLICQVIFQQANARNYFSSLLLPS